ncbi:MAG: RluA family pseudouridine synthase [Planctomycetes bacterium]|nr:RluA family pseudouridine synthase [Planctomycetota bacterium]
MPDRTVAAAFDRTDVVEFLAAQFPERSITGLRRLVGSGRVTVNGEAAQRHRTLRAGDVVSFPPLEELVRRYRPTAAAPRILCRRGEILAIDKPPGLAVLPERGGRGAEDAVVTRLLAELEPGERVYPVHRLDKDTSGVLLVATSRRAARELSRAFQDKQVHKTYRAIVRGVMLEDEGTIDMPLSRPRRQAQQVRVDIRSGKPAITHFRVLNRYRGFTEVALVPETGRTHQIRVHLRATGYPLAVDPIYGSPRGVMLSEIKRGYVSKPGVPEKPILSRLPLHSEALVFPLPGSEETLEVQAELPKDLRIFLTKLQRWGRLRNAR